MSRSNKQFVSKTLIMYMISALLFLTFVELHIHTQEAAVMESHGYAVSITAPANDLVNDASDNEISINPDSILKIKQTSNSMLAVFMLIAVLITVLCRTFIDRLRETNKQLPVIAFHGTPPLRGPPL